MALTKIGKEGITGIDNSSDATAITIDNSERVGIGLSSNIDRKLHVEVDNTYAAKFGGTAGGDFAIEIGQTGTNSSAGFNATGTGGAMKFSISGSEAMRIDTSGNLLVGRISSTSSTVGCELDTIGRAMFTRASGLSLLLNRTTDDGSIAEFRKDNSVVGSIGTNSGILYIGSTEGTDAFLGFGNDIIRPVTSAGASRDNAIDLGYNGMRFRDLYLSSSVYIKGSTPKITLEHSNENGTAQIYTTAQSAIILDADPANTDNGTPIQFKIDGNEVGRFDSGGRLITPYGVTLGTSAGTYSAGNTLDDYEEGTWTPTMGGTTTYYQRSGEYTKVGNKVFVRGQVHINAIGTGSTVQIQGLPFTSKTTSNGNPAGALNITYYSNLAIAVNFIAGHVTSASSNIQIIANAGNNTTIQYNTGNFFGNNTRLDFSMVYQVA